MNFIYEFEGKLIGKKRMFIDLKKEGWTSLPKRKKTVQKEFDSMIDALINWKKAISRNVFHGEGEHKLYYVNEAENDEILEVNTQEVISEFLSGIDKQKVKCISVENIEIVLDYNVISGGVCTFVFDFDGKIIYESCLFDDTYFEINPEEFSFLWNDNNNVPEDLLPFSCPMDMLKGRIKFPKNIMLRK